MKEQPSVVWLFEPDTISETESVDTQDMDDEFQNVLEYSTLTFEDHVARNTRLFNELKKTEQPNPNDPSKKHLVSPTASQLASYHLHPWFYTQCVPIENLEALAQILQAPHDWRMQIDAAMQNQFVALMLRDLHSANEQDESVVESRFGAFVFSLSFGLNRHSVGNSAIRYGVGGLLPDPDCAYVGKIDVVYYQNEQMRFVTEAKTSSSYPLHQPWYRKSRAPQSFGALYYTNVPVLLYSPQSYKLLLKSPTSDRVHVFPVHETGGTFYSGETSSTDFVHVVGLLLLAGPNLQLPEPVIQTPIQRRQKVQGPDTIRKYGKSRRSARIASSAARRPTDPSGIPDDSPSNSEQISDSPPAPIYRLSPEQIDMVFQMASVNLASV